MPLNMNTVGTGNISSNNTSNSGTFITQNTKNLSTRLVSVVYNQNINRLNIHSGNYMKELYDSGYFSDRSGTLYKNCFYQFKTDRKYYEYSVYKYELVSADDVTYLSATSIPLPAKFWTDGNGAELSVLQIGDYLYIFSGQNANSANMKYLYRFDGSSFTVMNNSVSPYKYFFNETEDVDWSKGEDHLYITPILSDLYEGNIVMIDLYGCPHTSNDNDSIYGYTGIFRIDNEGFHLLERRYFYHYGRDYEIMRYLGHYILLTSNNEYYSFSINSQNLVAQQYEIGYNYYSGDIEKPTYSRVFTLKNTITIGQSVNTNAMPTIVRVSYPQYDTWMVCAIQHNNIGKWVQIKPDSKGLNHKPIQATFDNALRGGLYTYDKPSDIHIVSNNNKPFLYLRNGYEARGSLKISANFIDWDATYSSDKAVFNYTGYLLEGDTVCCDDGIISFILNEIDTPVNNTRLTIKTNGYYTIRTHVNDAYIYPSFVILDKNNNIVYAKSSILPDGSLEGYFIRGMKVNGIDVKESKKAIFKTANDRYEIRLGGK